MWRDQPCPSKQYLHNKSRPSLFRMLMCSHVPSASFQGSDFHHVCCLFLLGELCFIPGLLAVVLSPKCRWRRPLRTQKLFKRSSLAQLYEHHHLPI